MMSAAPEDADKGACSLFERMFIRFRLRPSSSSSITCRRRLSSAIEHFDHFIEKFSRKSFRCIERFQLFFFLRAVVFDFPALFFDQTVEPFEPRPA